MCFCAISRLRIPTLIAGAIKRRLFSARHHSGSSRWSVRDYSRRPRRRLMSLRGYPIGAARVSTLCWRAGLTGASRVNALGARRFHCSSIKLMDLCTPIAYRLSRMWPCALKPEEWMRGLISSQLNCWVMKLSSTTRLPTRLMYGLTPASRTPACYAIETVCPLQQIYIWRDRISIEAGFSPPCLQASVLSTSRLTVRY